ncbi:recombinase family protein [Sulfitobacter dubius]|uniref:recombinase family protein n=1 Tax=Sulfitobacter dubius TaxID=218673 RepID=UPI0022AF7BEC|nr:recombinase family protein [Sulfitobacter dubius]MCZ4367457.1 recombinase family protein [Sulfitobacter dubius]
MQQTILYARVSTADQTAEHQLSHAKNAGFKIDRVITDDGVSGVAIPFRDRPEAKRLFDILRAGDVLVVRWVDRLGRNYDDVTTTIRAFMRKGVIIRTVINNFTFDGSTIEPVQKAVRDALIAFMAATAQAQAEATKEAQKAGILHAKADRTKYRGKKPSYNMATFNRVKNALALGTCTISEIARDCGLSRQTVLRIRDNTERAQEALEKWGS